MKRSPRTSLGAYAEQVNINFSRVQVRIIQLDALIVTFMNRCGPQTPEDRIRIEEIVRASARLLDLADEGITPAMD